MNKKDFLLNKLYPIEKLLNSKSKKSNIRCPNPHHLDRKASSHIYENKVWCFTCKRFFDVIYIITVNEINKNEIFEDLKENKSLFSDELSDIIGLKDNSIKYYLDKNYRGKKSNNLPTGSTSC